MRVAWEVNRLTNGQKEASNVKIIGLDVGADHQILIQALIVQCLEFYLRCVEIFQRRAETW